MGVRVQRRRIPHDQHGRPQRFQFPAQPARLTTYVRDHELRAVVEIVLHVRAFQPCGPDPAAVLDQVGQRVPRQPGEQPFQHDQQAPSARIYHARLT